MILKPFSRNRNLEFWSLVPRFVFCVYGIDWFKWPFMYIFFFYLKDVWIKTIFECYNWMLKNKFILIIFIFCIILAHVVNEGNDEIYKNYRVSVLYINYINLWWQCKKWARYFLEFLLNLLFLYISFLCSCIVVCPPVWLTTVTTPRDRRNAVTVSTPPSR